MSGALRLATALPRANSHMKTSTRLQVASCRLLAVLTFGTALTVSATPPAAQQVEQAKELNRTFTKKFSPNAIKNAPRIKPPAERKARLQPDGDDLARWFAAEGVDWRATKVLLLQSELANRDLSLLGEKMKSATIPAAFSTQVAANAKLIAEFSRQLEATAIARIQIESALPDGQPSNLPPLPSADDRQNYEYALRDTGIKAKQARDRPDNFASPLPVTARTKNSQGVEVKNLQVYWRQAPFPEQRAEFNQLSSPTETALPAGLYYFWSATIDSQPREGRKVLREVSGANPVDIDVPAP